MADRWFKVRFAVRHKSGEGPVTLGYRRVKLAADGRIPLDPGLTIPADHLLEISTEEIDAPTLPLSEVYSDG